MGGLLLSTPGARLAVAKINARGGVHGVPIRLLEYDTQTSPLGARQAARRAVADGVSVIVGPSLSSQALAAAQVAQAAGTPLVCNVATHPEITAVGDYIFRVCFSDNTQGQALADFLRQHLGSKRLALLVNASSDYSMDLARIVTERFLEHGGQVVAREEYVREETDFSSLLKTLMVARPDVLFCPAHWEITQILAVLRQRQEADQPVPTLVGGDGISFPGLSETTEGLRTPIYFASQLPAKLAPEVLEGFPPEITQTPHPAAAGFFAWDAVHLVADAIARAGSDEPAAIRTALARTRDFPTITGPLTFNAQGDPLRRPIYILSAKDGVISDVTAILGVP